MHIGAHLYHSQRRALHRLNPHQRAVQDDRSVQQPLFPTGSWFDHLHVSKLAANTMLLCYAVRATRYCLGDCSDHIYVSPHDGRVRSCRACSPSTVQVLECKRSNGWMQPMHACDEGFPLTTAICLCFPDTPRASPTPSTRRLAEAQQGGPAEGRAGMCGRLPQVLPGWNGAVLGCQVASRRHTRHTSC